jgi:hypothetical protein
MKSAYLLTLVAVLLVIVAVGSYEAFRGSSGGALMQLTSSHVPSEDEIRRSQVYGLASSGDDEVYPRIDTEDCNLRRTSNMDNSPYSPNVPYAPY